MRKKNGFTLVELLAVIVVLAIIMIIAIPSVLETMNTARKQSFVLYIEKVISGVTTQYTYDANVGSIAGPGYYVYDITQDLSLTSTGSYRGFVVVNATDVDNVHYIVTLYDNNYIIQNYDVTANNMPTVNTEELKSNRSDNNHAKTAQDVCANATGSTETNCMNRNGYIITRGNKTIEDNNSTPTVDDTTPTA